MTKDKIAPSYITHNGSRYERVSNDSVEVALDLEEDVVDKLNDLVTQGKYVSVGDAVRDILRQEIRDASKKNPKQPKGPKKPPNAPRQPQRKPPTGPVRRGR